MITIHDVAKMAGTSTATVSHVINGTRFVSDELQKKVREAMRTEESLICIGEQKRAHLA